MSDVPERLLRLAWEHAEAWSRQTPDNPRPLSIRDMVIIRLGVESVLSDLHRQVEVCRSAAVSAEAEANLHGYDEAMYEHHAEADAFGTVLALLKTGGSDE